MLYLSGQDKLYQELSLRYAKTHTGK